MYDFVNNLLKKTETTLMKILAKIDGFLIYPFQKIVSLLERKGYNSSMWLIVWSTLSALLFLIAEALQTYVNMVLGHDNYGYTNYAGIKSLELKALYLNVLPFMMTIMLSIAINSRQRGKESFIGNMFLGMMTKGEPQGLLARILYVNVFILTVADISEFESPTTIWHIIRRHYGDYHYFLGLAGAIAVILCFFSFLMAAISMFFIGCDYAKEK